MADYISSHSGSQIDGAVDTVLNIQQTTGENTGYLMSQKAITDAITAAQPEIVQTTGTSETAVISQSAVTKALDGKLGIDSVVDIAHGGTGATVASVARTNLEIPATVLYSNAIGTTGTITLSQPYTNFVRIGVYIQGQSNNYSFYNEMLTSTNYMVLNSTCINDNSYNMLVWRLACINFTENIVTFLINGAGSLTSGPNNYLTLGTSDGLKITQVVGYNY